jgi:hypothetical protein
MLQHNCRSLKKNNICGSPEGCRRIHWMHSEMILHAPSDIKMRFRVVADTTATLKKGVSASKQLTGGEHIKGN